MTEPDTKPATTPADKAPWLTANNIQLAVMVLTVGVMLNFWKTPEKQIEERLALEARLNKIENKIDVGIQGVQGQISELSKQMGNQNTSTITMSEFRVWVMELHAKNPTLAVPTVGEWQKKP